MAMWRCPHCATPQAETARCWVCKRSSTSCGTCLHFRRSVAPGIGYCGHDRRRVPLDGREIRPCWEGAPVSAVTARPPATHGSRGERPRLDFVPVGRPEIDVVGDVAAPTSPARITGGAAERGGLWDDIDRTGVP